MFLAFRGDWAERYESDLRARGEPATREEAFAPVLLAEHNAAADLQSLMTGFFTDGSWIGPFDPTDDARSRSAATKLARYQALCRRVRGVLAGRVLRHDDGLPSTTREGIDVLQQICRSEIRLYASSVATWKALKREDAAISVLASVETLCVVGNAWQPMTRDEFGYATEHDLRTVAAMRETLAGGLVPLSAAHDRLGPLLTQSRVTQWRRMLRVERVDAITNCRPKPPPAGQPTAPGAVSPIDRLSLALWRWSSRRQMLDRFAVLDQVIALEGDDPFALRAELVEIVDAQDLKGKGPPMWGYECLGLFDDAVRSDAELIIVRVALAAGAYRVGKGRWPKATDALRRLLGGVEPPGIEGYRVRLVVQEEGDLEIHVSTPKGVEPVAPMRLPADR